MPESKKLVWDQVGEKFYETGVDRGVIYPMTGATYGTGEAWNGLMSVDEQPSGAEPTPLYANNRKYLELMSVEEFGMTIGAYTFPKGFYQCLGKKELAPGVYVNQQTHVPFGMTYRTLIGNDTEKNAHGYKIHLVYGATAKPSEKPNKTVNENNENEKNPPFKRSQSVSNFFNHFHYFFYTIHKNISLFLSVIRVCTVFTEIMFVL